MRIVDLFDNTKTNLSVHPWHLLHNDIPTMAKRHLLLLHFCAEIIPSSVTSRNLNIWISKFVKKKYKHKLYVSE